MRIVRINTSSFQKGEASVKGLVEDQGETFEISLYLRSGRVRGHSCSCNKGNSYRGICAHGKAPFAYYNRQGEEASRPAIHIPPQVHTMVREYANREVALVLAEEAGAQVGLEPVLILDGKGTRLEFEVGITRFHAVYDLRAFKETAENETHVVYGKGLSFRRHKSAFTDSSKELLVLLMGGVQNQKAVYSLTLNRMNQDRFFEIVAGRTVEAQPPGGNRVMMDIEDSNPVASPKVERVGRGGLKTSLMGVAPTIEGGAPRPMAGCFRGEWFLYVVSGQRLYQCSEPCTQVIGLFVKQMCAERDESVPMGRKDTPLFCKHVVKHVLSYCHLMPGDVDFKDYEPESLEASLRFDTGEDEALMMEPSLAYGSYEFHSLEDENLPRTICRDIPGEFRVGQLIHKYFKHKDLDGRWLVIGNNEDEIYRLMTEGMDEFHSMGDVYMSENLYQWEVPASPRVTMGASAAGGQPELDMDTGGINNQGPNRVLTAYSQKKKYYRLKNGQFLGLDESGLTVIGRVASEMGVTREGPRNGKVHLPTYHVFYPDYLFKESTGVTCYRDQMLKVMVRLVKSVEDSDFTASKRLKGVLREYRRIGCVWLRTLDSHGFGGILTDGTGLGETVQIVALLGLAYGSGEQSSSLTMCLTSLVYNWEYEIRRFASGLKVSSVVESGSEREDLLREAGRNSRGYQVIITSYDLPRGDMGLYEGVHLRYQVIDEAQYIKNASTQSAKAVKSLDMQTRLALTGMPVGNRLGELWSIFDYLMPGPSFGNQFSKKEYEAPIIRDDDAAALERLRRIIGPFALRRIGKGVLKELPDKMKGVIYSSFEPEQRKSYAANAAKFKEKLSTGGFDRAGEGKLQILVELMRLRQIYCDPQPCHDSYKSGPAKLKTCMDLVRRGVAGGYKILLFSQFTSVLGTTHIRPEKEGTKSYLLTGVTSKEERIRLVGDFGKDEVPVSLISLKAGGTGLNLTAVDVVIHCGPWRNVATQNQAMGRAHWISRGKQVTVYRLIAKNTIEENILGLQKVKSHLADTMVPEGTVSFGSLTRDDILNIIEEE